MYEKPMCYKPKTPNVKKEIRGGESETAPPESSILMRSSANQGRADKFFGFKQRGKI